MSQLIDNLNIIESVKTEIKTAIENKGVDMTGVSFPGYASKIGEITTSFVTVPLNVSSNGTYTPSEGVNGYSQVNVNVPAPQFVTETLNVNENGTYTPGQGIDGYSQVVVDVPISGWDQKSLTEGTIEIINLDNTASFVASNAFMNNTTIQTVNLPYATSVGNNAFEGCSSLSQISLPVCGVINFGAFRYCSLLSQASLPMCRYIGNSVFEGCSSLTQVSLPMCSYIGYYVFYGCSSLTQVSLPVCSVIDFGAFQHCSSLSIITIGYSSVCSLHSSNDFSNTQITSSTGSIYVPASLVDAYKSATNWSYFSTQIFSIPKDLEFRNGLVYGWASYLDSGYLNELGITAPDVTSVSMSLLTSISSSTFMNHYNMVSYDIPNLIEYPDDAFNGCSSLSELYISIPVGNRAFANCTGLTVVNIEGTNGIIPAGSDIFSNCNNLSSIYVPDNYYDSYISADGWSEYSSIMLKTIPKISFSNGLVYGSIKSIDSTYTTELSINKNDVISVDLINCENVGLQTFYSNQQLTQVNLPECVSLGVSAFAECIRLQTISLPKCEYIGSNCFQGAFQSNTTGYNININLPVCSYIGDCAFWWTKRSLTLTLGYDGVVNLPNDTGHTFSTTTVRSIYVPASLVDAYKSAPIWSQYSNRIFPIE